MFKEFNKKEFEDTKGQSESVYHRRTDNTMAKGGWLLVCLMVFNATFSNNSVIS
jgi:hypothetical protein